MHLLILSLVDFHQTTLSFNLKLVRIQTRVQYNNIIGENAQTTRTASVDLIITGYARGIKETE